jgi:hypothetical protein
MPSDEGRRESRKNILASIIQQTIIWDGRETRMTPQLVASLRYFSSMLYNEEHTIRVGNGENVKGAIPCFNGF